jgi:hypothetical protein
MKYIFSIIFIVSLILWWCNNTKDIIKKEDVIIWSWVTSWWVSEINSMWWDKIITWTLSSGLVISNSSWTILLSWNILFYRNIFSFSLKKDIYTDWTYALLDRIGNSWQVEQLRINDIAYYWMNIYSNDFDQIQSIQEICTPDYQEWINYKPKTVELKKWYQTYYLTYAVFDIAAPDTVPSKNYNADICFVKNNKIYHISIDSPTQHRKDIVDSLTFL